jgi:hypothetical protein
MGFLICRVHPLAADGVTVETVRHLALSGASGLFASHLPKLATDDGTWSLTAEALLRLAEPSAHSSDAIAFELITRSRERKTFYRLVEVTGRTVSLVTDALFRFKVLKPLAAVASPSADSLVYPAYTGWVDGPERYEQLRLEGGTVGGDWSWAESPAGVCATVLG